MNKPTKSKSMSKKTCNQCFEQMETFSYEHNDELNHAHLVTVCVNQKCPNYSLMQVSVEKTKSLLSEIKRKIK